MWVRASLGQPQALIGGSLTRGHYADYVSFGGAACVGFFGGDLGGQRLLSGGAEAPHTGRALGLEAGRSEEAAVGLRKAVFAGLWATGMAGWAMMVEEENEGLLVAASFVTAAS